MRRAQTTDVDVCTDYAADAGDIERDVARIGASAAYADMMNRAPQDLNELAARLIT